MPTKSRWATCLFMVLVTFCLPCVSFAGGPYRVKADAKGANNGTSWADAFTDLQKALLVAQWGEEIWVAAGTYKPTSGTDRTKSFGLVAGRALYGGFAGTETTRAQRNWLVNKTILSGDIGTPGKNTDNSFVVIRGAALSVLDGFTITSANSKYRNPTLNGAGMSNDATSLTVANCSFIRNTTSGRGGGVYNNRGSLSMTNCSFIDNIASTGAGMYNDSCSPIVSDCTFTSNTTDFGHGGGIYNHNSSPRITRCIFNSNTAWYSRGGGMYNSGSSPIVDSCTFINNSSEGGGGMYNYEGSPTVTHCIFSGNSTSVFGAGGMSNYNCSPRISCSVFYANTGSDDYTTVAGGIYNSGSSPVLTNCTFFRNTAGNWYSSCGGMYNSTKSSPTLTNCIFWENSTPYQREIHGGKPTLRNCDIRGSGGSGALWDAALGADGGGNLMADPCFVDPLHPIGADGIWMTADDGLRLRWDSPCINTGATGGAPATDILGQSRLGLPEIGAYEYNLPINGVADWASYH